MHLTAIAETQVCVSANKINNSTLLLTVTLVCQCIVLVYSMEYIYIY